MNIWPETQAVKSAVCKALGRKNGFYTDAAAEKYECDSKGQAPSVASSASADGEFRDILTLNTNLVWEALKSSPLFDGSSIEDIEMREMIMTLTGTIINATAGDTGETSIHVIAPTANDGTVLKAFLDGDSIDIHQCVDTALCLNVAQHSKTVALGDAAFGVRVRELIEQLIAISNDPNGELTDEHIEFLGKTTLPIYKMILVDTAYTRGNGTALNPAQYSDAVALDITYTYIDTIVSLTRRAVSQKWAASKLDKLEAWQSAIWQIKHTVAQQKMEVLQKVQATQSMMMRTMQFEKIIASNVSSQVANAFRWSTELTR